MVVHCRIERLQSNANRRPDVRLPSRGGFSRDGLKRRTEKRGVGRKRTKQHTLVAERDKRTPIPFEGVDEIGDVRLGPLQTVRAHIIGEHRTAHVERDHHVPALRRNGLRTASPLRPRRRQQTQRQTGDYEDRLHKERLRAIREQALPQGGRDHVPEPAFGAGPKVCPQYARERHKQHKHEHPWIYEAHYTSLLDVSIWMDTAANTIKAPASRKGGKYSRYRWKTVRSRVVFSSESISSSAALSPFASRTPK